MIRKRILLASLLKPVSDTRMFGKIAQSLAKFPELEVHVAGFSAAVPPENESPDITLHPIFNFRRLSFNRLLAQKKYWNLLSRLKPDLIVAGTHELLFTSWLYCRQAKAKLVYDVQENYFLNLTTQGVYQNGLGTLMGHSVRKMEALLANKVDHFFLAEESYADELPFLGDRFTVLQNKYRPPVHLPDSKKRPPVLLETEQPLRLLYSGTISRLYGVLEAIQFTKELRQWAPAAQLTIIGYCPDADFLQEVRLRISGLPYIHLLGGDRLVPHQQILELEQTHHVGLLPYRPHPSTFRCVPTKLFEYQANGLVVVAQQNPIWQKMLHSNNTGLTNDFLSPINQQFAHLLLHQRFYLNNTPKDVFWGAEEEQVQQIIKQLLRKPEKEKYF